MSISATTIITSFCHVVAAGRKHQAKQSGLPLPSRRVEIGRARCSSHRLQPRGCKLSRVGLVTAHISSRRRKRHSETFHANLEVLASSRGGMTLDRFAKGFFIGHTHGPALVSTPPTSCCSSHVLHDDHQRRYAFRMPTRKTLSGAKRIFAKSKDWTELGPTLLQST